MAQTAFHNYRAALISYNENSRFVGIIEPQRYRGFDSMEILDSLNNRVRINHTNPYSSPISEPRGFLGARKTGVNSPLTLEPLYGAFLTRQGVIVHVDNSIPEVGQFTVLANPTAFTRIDLVIARHSHVLSEGGQPATFFYLTGLASATPQLPTLIQETDVILGRVIVREGFANFQSTPNSAYYVPEPLRGLGGDEFLSLNRATQLRSIFAIGEHSSGVTIDVNGLLDLDGINPTGGIIRISAHSGIINRIIYRRDLVGTTIRLQNDTAANISINNQVPGGLDNSPDGNRGIFTGNSINVADAPGPAGDDYESLDFIGNLTSIIVIRPGESVELQLRAFSGYGNPFTQSKNWVVLGGSYDRMRMEAMALTLVNLQAQIADLDNRVSFLEDYGQVPIGKIIFCPDTLVPANYAICDGGTYTIPLEFGGGSRITPDLRNRFLRQGQDPVTEAVSFAGSDVIEVVNLPLHTHSISSDGEHVHTLSRRGNQGGQTVPEIAQARNEFGPFSSADGVFPAGDHNHGGATGDGGFSNSVFRPRHYNGLFIMRLY